MRPRWHNDHALLAAVAARMESERVERDGRLLAAGKIDARTAAGRTRIASAIARSWRSIAALEPEPFGIEDPETGGALRYERHSLLAAAATTARALADANGGDDEATGYADALDTLLWWELAQPSARFLVDATIALRAQEAARRAALTEPAFNFGEAA